MDATIILPESCLYRSKRRMSEINEILEEIDEPKSESEISPPAESASRATGAVVSIAAEFTGRIGKRRWVICALLFFAATINYIDRQVFGIITTDETFRATIGWNAVEYGWIQTAFQGAYAAGL